MLIVSVSANEEKASEEFYNKYRVDLDLFSKLNDFIQDYNEKYTVKNEENLPLHKRDMNRISYLVNMIRGLPNFENSIEQLFSSI
ncbi:MAG: hypothetical protein GY754_23095 [bacterium]|nr:hypothetical protein [bacterium]